MLTQTSKRDAFLELRSRLAGRTIELPNSPELLRDLRMVRSRYAAGVSSVVTPRSAESHADLAVALALAAYELRHVRDGKQAMPVAGRIVDAVYEGFDERSDPTRTLRWYDGDADLVERVF